MRLKKLLVQAAFIFLMITGLSFSASADYTHENVFGFGFGLPYGGLGINYELGLNDYLAPTIGVGYLPENIGWNAGVRLYYPGRDYILRGRITALYGTNTLLERKGSGSDYKTETGISVGIGFDWRFGEEWGFCGDLLLADKDTPAGYEEKSGDIFLALGFSYRW